MQIGPKIPTLLSAVCLLGLRAMGQEARFRLDRKDSSIPFLSWDSEGGSRLNRNLLRAPIAENLLVERDGGIDLTLRREEGIPFNPRVTPTTILSATWNEDGSFHLPAILNAPDFGPLLLTQTSGPTVTGRLEGSRSSKTVDLILHPAQSKDAVLRMTPLMLPVPPGVEPGMWKKARRGWLNAIQPCAKWGEQNRPFSAPAGILGNNVISDPASSSLWFYADQAFFIPEPAPGVSLMPMVRRTIDYWIDQKMKETGEVICYWDYTNFLDANAGPIIASWDYVESTGDTEWLQKKIGRLEKVADFLISRDIDNDGLIEATQSGNYNTLQQPARSCAWWDALNCGHKDGYTNAIIYRAFR
jgi:hypothetical protein